MALRQPKHFAPNTACLSRAALTTVTAFDSLINFLLPCFVMSGALTTIVDAIWNEYDSAQFQRHTYSGQTVEVETAHATQQIIKGGGLKNDVPLWLFWAMFAAILITRTTHRLLLNDKVKKRLPSQKIEFYSHELTEMMATVAFIMTQRQSHNLNAGFLTLYLLPIYAFLVLSKHSFDKYIARKPYQDIYRPANWQGSDHLINKFMYASYVTLALTLGINAFNELIVNTAVGGYKGEWFQQTDNRQYVENVVSFIQIPIATICFFSSMIPYLKQKIAWQSVQRLPDPQKYLKLSAIAGHAAFFVTASLYDPILIGSPEVGGDQFTAAKGQVTFFLLFAIGIWAAVRAWRNNEPHHYSPITEVDDYQPIDTLNLQLTKLHRTMADNDSIGAQYPYRRLEDVLPMTTFATVATEGSTRDNTREARHAVSPALSQTENN